MDTIFALATAPIKSGVAIIRISGEAAANCASVVTKKSLPKPRLAQLSKFYNPANGELIDEGVILWFPAPASFTGEDVVELHTHGSLAVINEIFSVLSSIKGVRMAEPGEFSRRAFENNKMDLTEAEGLADLIDSETKAQAKQALLQKQGHLKILYEEWRSNIIKILAHVEAYIDFPDEEIPTDVVEQITGNVGNLIKSIETHLNDNRRGERLRSGLSVVILGAPNVGKSSLINCLARRDVAIVSDIAGTTRDIIEVHLDLKGYPVVLVDTAGIREKADLIEKEGIRRAIERSENADLKIVMFDAKDFPSVDIKTRKMIDSNSIVVINKVDEGRKIAIPKELSDYKPISISVNEKSGIDNLLNCLENKAIKAMEVSSAPVITRQRHRALLQDSLLCLKSFDLNKDIELVAEDLHGAASAIGKITGHIGVEDILDVVFSSFCIGK